MLRASVETGVVCQNEKHRKQKHARFSATHSTWRSSKRPLSLTHSLAVFTAIAGRTADELLGLHRQPNKNIGRLNLMILSIRERSDSYVLYVFYLIPDVAKVNRSSEFVLI